MRTREQKKRGQADNKRHKAEWIVDFCVDIPNTMPWSNKYHNISYKTNANRHKEITSLQKYTTK